MAVTAASTSGPTQRNEFEDARQHAEHHRIRNPEHGESDAAENADEGRRPEAAPAYRPRAWRSAPRTTGAPATGQVWQGAIKCRAAARRILQEEERRGSESGAATAGTKTCREGQQRPLNRRGAFSARARRLIDALPQFERDPQTLVIPGPAVLPRDDRLAYTPGPRDDFVDLLCRAGQHQRRPCRQAPGDEHINESNGGRPRQTTRPARDTNGDPAS